MNLPRSWVLSNACERACCFHVYALNNGECKMTGKWLISCVLFLGLELGFGLGTDSSQIHIAICAEKYQIEGLLVVVGSVLRTCSDNNTHFFFHIISTQSSMQDVRQSMECLSASLNLDFDVYEFNLSKHTSNVSFMVRGKANRRLGNPLNFARFYLHSLLPWRSFNFEKIVYLDTDCLVLSCIAPMSHYALTSSTAPLAAAYRPLRISYWLGGKDKEHHPSIIHWNKFKGMPVNGSLIAFNAGVFVLHLRRWEEMNILDDVLYWIRANSQSYIYNLGSNPPLILGLAGRVEYIDKTWNVDGLGYKQRMPQKTLAAGRILHWTGPKKPWRKDALPRYLKIWNNFRILQCEM